MPTTDRLPLSQPQSAPSGRKTHTNADKLFDEELRRRVGQALERTRRESFRSLIVEVDRREVALAGRVVSAFERQLAVSIARQIEGVASVCDRMIAPEVVETIAPEKISSDGSEVARMRRRVKVYGVSRIPSLRTLSIGAAVLVAIIASLPYLTDSIRYDGRLPVYPVKGSVTYFGRPLIGATIVLHPKNFRAKNVVLAKARTNEQGEFIATTYEANDGAPPGEYAVTVLHYKDVEAGEIPEFISPKHASPATTDIAVQVAKGVNHLQPIELSR